MNIKKLKNIKPVYLVAMLLLGALIMMISNLLPLNNNEAEVDEPKEKSPPYNNDAEIRLGKLIGDIDGVSDVTVFITYENNGVRSVATIGEESTMSDSEKSSSSRKQEVVTKKQGSGEEPFVNEEILPQVRGIIISARGLKSKTLAAQVTDAVASAMGVPLHRVKVISKD